MASTRIFDKPLVYFIQGELTKRIKIGKTNTAISERIRNMQTGSPDKLIFLGACFGVNFTEEKMHEVFKEYRLHGEWFEPNEVILNFIDSNCFTNYDALYHAFYEIEKGELSYQQALEIGDVELSRRSEKKSINIMKNMYMKDGKSVLFSRKLQTARQSDS